MIAEALWRYLRQENIVKAGEDVKFHSMNPYDNDAFFEVEITKMKEWKHVNDDGGDDDEG